MRRQLLWTAAAAAAPVLAATALTWARRHFSVVTIAGGSMAPTYQDGDRVLVRRTDVRSLRAGDVVVIEEPRSGDQGGEVARSDVHQPATREWMIKRILALPGEPVPRADVPALATAPGEVVPRGCVVVVGDAGRRSYDSKQAGYFSLDRVLGVAVRPMRAN
ncbi:signal peptidase I [Micromonospora mangrovi]|uniref:Signal peptidase I n=2 Tax=Micromonospora TaxID=1873 RepID=A0AAU7M3M1_9ACTN